MPVRVLFLCTGNSARSVLAEGLLKSMGGDDFEVHSAGTQPKGINPYSERVLAQAHIKMDGFRSKNVSEFEGQDFDYVITVCDQAAEACPSFPGGAERIHWGLPDPAAVQGTDLQRLNAFQETLRDLRQRLQLFIAVAGRAQQL